MTQIRITISALASPEIGTGHLRRMMALAEGFLDDLRIALCIHTTALGAEILKGHPFPPDRVALAIAPDDPAVAAIQLAGLLRAQPSHAVIVDNYYWRAETETVLRQPGTLLCVVDDLADRPHLADVLIDQNANQTDAAYRGLVPVNCRLGVGSRFCLLSRPFREQRARGIPDPAARIARDQIFISLGGGDPNRDLPRILHNLLELTDLRLSVATGSHVPDAAALRALAAARPDRIELALDSDRVAEQMQASAMAIAAGGTMTWERAVLGLPTLCLVIADNQVATAVWMEDQGMHRTFDMRGGWQDADFAAAFRAFAGDDAALMNYARRSSALVDGRGVQNAVALIRDEIAVA
ncbi:UDP-2,4-diacetamido-2,4,6-trideoxy-beta-L-altropyranose hydrolase [Paracoccus sp. (in: a-proteobacteria)]|jgi:UDP-2,4-diacetamido-2,4,6-trideoxy-beta-L-altropyranose hydrolase|uniref:UDP-2,4-diacetamido-2,4, 6-trideoxy-beta-L-altropyranose hydrolase n=1 Tax=Paracoccus sp. TaxID=267 RepID=UPI00258DAB28|nr:UDP-2,4-diacetamido-2,4,6-trideoxy-beta-L-altropyranose hydrolase [Paracoccus sp. (in: a-proteobacteria)]